MIIGRARNLKITLALCTFNIRRFCMTLILKEVVRLNWLAKAAVQKCAVNVNFQPRSLYLFYTSIVNG